MTTIYTANHKLSKIVGKKRSWSDLPQHIKTLIERFIEEYPSPDRAEIFKTLYKLYEEGKLAIFQDEEIITFIHCTHILIADRSYPKPTEKLKDLAERTNLLLIDETLQEEKLEKATIINGRIVKTYWNNGRPELWKNQVHVYGEVPLENEEAFSIILSNEKYVYLTNPEELQIPGINPFDTTIRLQLSWQNEERFLMHSAKLFSDFYKTKGEKIINYLLQIQHQVLVSVQLLSNLHEALNT